MSFGGPGGGAKAQKPMPPERGSFPLDHDGECKPLISSYLRCVRRNQGNNAAECRLLAKGYLACRMEHNLMAPDSFANLGFHDAKASGDSETSPSSGTQTDGRSAGGKRGKAAA